MSERNGILQKAVNSATEKLAARGVEGCSTKEVILAALGPMIQNGGVATSDQVVGLTKEMRKFGLRVVSAVISILITVILVLIFV